MHEYHVGQGQENQYKADLGQPFCQDAANIHFQWADAVENARSDIPWLLALVERQRKALNTIANYYGVGEHQFRAVARAALGETE